MKVSRNMWFLMINVWICHYSLKSQNPTIQLETYQTNFTRPTDVETAGDARLFVSEMAGKIRIIQNNTVLTAPFLDLGNKVKDPLWQGIYSLAFHPNYAQNGKYYVLYVRAPDGFVQLSLFYKSSSDSNLADTTEHKILTIPYDNIIGHRGGEIAFGADGYLYITTGDNADGGRGVVGDPNNNAQNLAVWFGKILRIDVNSGNPYAIPSTNPYQMPNDNISDEIWARGLRNPWRMSFDKLTGALWLADNGQDGWEEVDFLPNTSNAPINFGWRCYEANHRYPAQTTCDDSNTMTFPLHEYAGFSNNGGTGRSVIGGYVYRGANHPTLYGHYIYGDYITGQLWSLYRTSDSTYTNTLQSPTIANLVGFGQDNTGEIYAISFYEGVLYKIKTNNCPPTQTLIQPLSGTQLFKASVQVQAQNMIQAGASIHYQAGQSVLLLPNFQVESGGVFKASIGGCQ